jgi:hypothetical protein
MKKAEKRKIVTRKIVEKATQMLETALQGDKEAFELRDLLYNMFSNQTQDESVARMKLGLNFFKKYRNIFPFFISDSSAKDKAYVFFVVDMVFATSLDKNVPKGMINKYDELKDEMYQWTMKNDRNPKYYDFYELIYLDGHKDLLYFSGLLLTKEEMGVEF